MKLSDFDWIKILVIGAILSALFPAAIIMWVIVIRMLANA